MSFKTRIRLIDIPTDGKHFVWDRKSGELNTVLADLIQELDYRVEFDIRPVNSRDYMLTGKIETQSPENCSMCGLDFKFPVHYKINEFLIPHQPQGRNSQYARVNHVSDANDQDGPQSFEYDASGDLDMGDYVHEAIAITRPANPKPDADEKGDCRKCGINFETHNFGFDEPMEVKKPENPFAVLKGIKLQ
jgi:uncharacterized protein